MWSDIALVVGGLMLAVLLASGSLLALDAVRSVRRWLRIRRTRRELTAQALAYAQEQREIDQALAVAMSHADWVLWTAELKDRSDR